MADLKDLMGNLDLNGDDKLDLNDALAAAKKLGIEDVDDVKKLAKKVGIDDIKDVANVAKKVSGLFGGKD